MITVAPDGRYNPSGKRFWFIPGKFGFCPCCLDQPHPSMRERTKLAGLLRNTAIAMGNSGLASYLPKLREWACGPDPVLAEAAQWAADRLTIAELEATP